MCLVCLESASNLTSIFVISQWVKRRFIQELRFRSLTWLDLNPSSTTYKRVKYMISPGFYFLICKMVIYYLIELL